MVRRVVAEAKVKIISSSPVLCGFWRLKNEADGVVQPNRVRIFESVLKGKNMKKMKEPIVTSKVSMTEKLAKEFKNPDSKPHTPSLAFKEEKFPTSIIMRIFTKSLFIGFNFPFSSSFFNSFSTSFFTC